MILAVMEKNVCAIEYHSHTCTAVVESLFDFSSILLNMCILIGDEVHPFLVFFIFIFSIIFSRLVFHFSYLKWNVSFLLFVLTKRRNWWIWRHMWSRNIHHWSEDIFYLVGWQWRYFFKELSFQRWTFCHLGSLIWKAMATREWVICDSLSLHSGLMLKMLPLAWSDLQKQIIAAISLTFLYNLFFNPFEWGLGGIFLLYTSSTFLDFMLLGSNVLRWSNFALPCHIINTLTDAFAYWESFKVSVLC